MIKFDEWLARQPKDPTKPIDPRMAWNAAMRILNDEWIKGLTAEREVSDKLEKAAQECADNLGLTYKQIMSICKEALAEVAAIRAGGK